MVNLHNVIAVHVIANAVKQSRGKIDCLRRTCPLRGCGCFVPRNDGMRSLNDAEVRNVSTFNPIRDCRSVERKKTHKTSIP